MNGGLLHDGLTRAVDRDAGQDAVRAGDRAWSYGDLDRLSDAFGHLLIDAGVRPRDRVALMTSNRVEFLVAVEAISKVGAASVLISPAWKAAEVAAAVALTMPRHAV